MATGKAWLKARTDSVCALSIANAEALCGDNGLPVKNAVSLVGCMVLAPVKSSLSTKTIHDAISI